MLGSGSEGRWRKGGEGLDRGTAEGVCWVHEHKRALLEACVPERTRAPCSGVDAADRSRDGLTAPRPGRQPPGALPADSTKAQNSFPEFLFSYTLFFNAPSVEYCHPTNDDFWFHSKSPPLYPPQSARFRAFSNPVVWTPSPSSHSQGKLQSDIQALRQYSLHSSRCPSTDQLFLCVFMFIKMTFKPLKT